MPTHPVTEKIQQSHARTGTLLAAAAATADPAPAAPVPDRAASLPATATEQALQAQEAADARLKEAALTYLKPTIERTERQLPLYRALWRDEALPVLALAQREDPAILRRAVTPNGYSRYSENQVRAFEETRAAAEDIQKAIGMAERALEDAAQMRAEHFRPRNGREWLEAAGHPHDLAIELQQRLVSVHLPIEEQRKRIQRLRTCHADLLAPLGGAA